MAIRIIDFATGFQTDENPASTVSASNISVTPTGDLSSTTVQAALVELQTDIDASEAAHSSHTSNTSNPHSVTKAQVGLSNVDNTSDMNKPVSTAQAAADAAVLSSAQSYANAAVASLVDSSPITLDTLNELAAALGDDPNFATTTATALGNRLRIDTDSQGLTGTQKTNAKTNIDLQNVDNTSDATKNAATATLTNKIYEGGTASATSQLRLPKAGTAVLTALGRQQGALYYDTDLGKAVLDNGSALNPVGSGSGTGTGSLNIVTNPSAENDTTGWTAATNYTVARDTSNSPLQGVVSTCLAMSTTTASTESSTSGVRATSLTMPAALRGGKVQANLWVTVPATSAGVWRLSVYNASGTRMTLDRDSSSVFTLPGGYTGQLPFTFDADSSATYTISFTQTTRSSANTLYATLISIGNGNVSQTFPGGEIALTSSVIGATNSSAYTNTTITNCVGQRVGSWLVVTGKLSFTGLPATGTGALVVRLSGTGLNIDSTKSQNWSGGGVFYDASASGAIYNLSPVPYMTSTNIDIQFTVSGDTASTTALNPASAPVAFANGDLLTFDIRIPIAEWAGSVNTAPVPAEEFAATSGTWDAASSTTVYGPAGQLIGGTLTAGRTKTITWQYPIQADDEIVVEGSRDQVTWAPMNGFNSSGGVVVPGINPTATDFSGVAVHSTSSTQTIVTFGRYLQCSDAAVATNWPSSGNYWRVRKTKKAALPFANAGTDGSAGLYKAGQAPGLKTGATIASEYVGETISATVLSAANNSTSATTLTNDLTLTAGVWRIVYFDTSYRSATPTSGTNAQATARIQNITDSTTIAQANSYQYITNVASDYEGMYNGSYHMQAIVNITSTKVYRGQGVLSSATGAVTTRGSGAFFAVRIA
jgi:hypothetical protein